MSNANVYIKDGRKGFYLSTKKGETLPKTLQLALNRGRDRWGDTPALARIIFSEMTHKEMMTNTGFGISTAIGDNDNFVLVIDDKNQKIGVFSETGTKLKDYTFNAFVGFTDDKLTWAKLAGRPFSENDVGDNTHSADLYPF
jgi:hypothetical protein